MTPSRLIMTAYAWASLLVVVVGIGWAGLWLPYAATIGKQRRAERERARRKHRKRR